MISLSQIVDTIQLDFAIPFTTSKTSTVNISDIVQIGPISYLFDVDVSLTDDVLEGTISLMVVVSDFVGSPISFMYFRDLSLVLTMYLLILHIWTRVFFSICLLLMMMLLYMHLAHLYLMYVI